MYVMHVSAAKGEGEEDGDSILQAAEQLEFSVGNPRLACTRGRVRLFRDGAPAALDSASLHAESDACGLPALRSTTVVCLGVPVAMTLPDFMEFLGEETLQTLSALRVVAPSTSSEDEQQQQQQQQRRRRRRQASPRDKDKQAASRQEAAAAGAPPASVEGAQASGEAATPSEGHYYLVVCEARSQAHADALFVHNNGRAYLGYGRVSPVACQLVFAARVEFDDGSGAAGEADAGAAALTELPSCPVCLERLDRDISGVLTTVCNHTFHAACMMNWGDASCPVCRYCARGEVTRCQTCGAGANLWMCLVCGHVGCGRYGAAHALEHFRETGHCYSLEVETQRVWDYVGDNYVHRLIQSHAGKLVELPTPARRSDEGEAAGGSGCGAGQSSAEGDCGALGGGGDELHSAVYESKVENVIFEYTALLSSQLESQRQHYESLLAASNASLGDDARAAIQSARDVAVAAEREKRSFSRRLSEAHARAERAEAEVIFLRSVNEQHESNAAAARKRLDVSVAAAAAVQKQKDARIAELEEQVRDLMLYLDASAKIEQVTAGGEGSGGGERGGAGSAELRDGSVVGISAAPTPPTPEELRRRARAKGKAQRNAAH